MQRGRESDRLRACAHCHYHNGQGKPENGHLTGLPVNYILQAVGALQKRRAPIHARRTVRQLYNYQQGTRHSQLMKPVVSKVSPEELIAIGAYLASL